MEQISDICRLRIITKTMVDGRFESRDWNNLADTLSSSDVSGFTANDIVNMAAVVKMYAERSYVINLPEAVDLMVLLSKLKRSPKVRKVCSEFITEMVCGFATREKDCDAVYKTARFILLNSIADEKQKTDILSTFMRNEYIKKHSKNLLLDIPKAA